MLSFFPIKKFGFDIGTSNTLIYQAKKGISVFQPSLVALNKKTSQMVAVGKEAEKMVDRVPYHISILKPVKEGVISDFEICVEFLKDLLKETFQEFLIFKKIWSVIAIPCGITEVERKTVEDVAKALGAGRIFLVENPLASAIGARLPIAKARGYLIIDIGGGLTEIGVISFGGIVNFKTLKIAGERLDQAIIDHIFSEYKLLIGQPTARFLKEKLGSVMGNYEGLEKEILIKGRDVSCGLPRELVISPKDVRKAIEPYLTQIIEAAKELLEETPPELIADIMENGVWLCGGGALLKGLDKLIAKELKLPTSIINEPLTAVVRGTGVIVENLENLEKIGIKR